MTANQEHTPTRIGLIAAWRKYNGLTLTQARDEVDVALAAAEQRGAARGWDEAMTAQIQRLISGDPDVERFQMPANPYRADRIADRLEGDDGDV